MFLRKEIFINIVVFQIGWLVCVQGNNVAAFVTALLVLIAHNLFICRDIREWLLIAGFASGGIIVDSLIQNSGLILFYDALSVHTATASISLLPLWMISLWLVFSTTLCHSLAPLANRMPVAALFGATGAPFSYFAGAKLSGSTLAEPLIGPLLVEGIFWALYFPLGLLAAQKLSLIRRTPAVQHG
ncbi:MAG: DUF2878 domain-containing protein [bacterium]